VNPTNAGEAWVVMNNYRQNDWKPYLFKTSNFGKTWTQHANKGDVKGHCLSVLQDSEAPNLVWLGTDQGLWVSFNGGNTTNVIPSEVKLMGTFRAMDETWRYKAHSIITRLTIGIAESMGAEAEIKILGARENEFTKCRVPNTRESIIFCFCFLLQRFSATPSPNKWITASTWFNFESIKTP